MKDKMYKLTLSFPHGASVKACEKIDQYAEKQVGAGVSEGGMEILSPFGLNPEDIEFSKDSMQFVYGHKRARAALKEDEEQTK